MSDKKLRQLDLPDAKGWMEELRERWAKLCSRYLEIDGVLAPVDHRSLRVWGIERAAGVHLGSDAIRMEKIREKAIDHHKKFELEKDMGLHT